MSTLVIVSAADTTRRELCLQCEHHRSFDVPTAGGAPDDFEETFSCKKRYISSCSMRAALLTKNAKCPRDDEWGLRWNAAGLDKGRECERERAQPDVGPPIGMDDRLPSGAIGQRGGSRAIFKVYKADKGIGR